MAKHTRPPWPTRPNGTQKTMGEMTRTEQDAQLGPILADLKTELSVTLPKLLSSARTKRRKATR